MLQSGGPRVTSKTVRACVQRFSDPIAVRCGVHLLFETMMLGNRVKGPEPGTYRPRVNYILRNNDEVLADGCSLETLSRGQWKHLRLREKGRTMSAGELHVEV
jgi:hypothetical protein